MSVISINQLSLRVVLPCALLFTAGCASKPPAKQPVKEAQVAHSQLWGRDGELWFPAGRLPDFSYAGYHSGEQPIPDYPPTTSVVAFGARGDDDVDDTAAFQAALAETVSGAVIVPPGRYIISDILSITKPGVVLRGAGAENTTLYFPKPLEAIKPDSGATTSGRPTSNYSWSGGLVRLEGKLGSIPLTFITEPAERGDQVITVEKPQSLAVGQWIEVSMTDTKDNTLAIHLYSGDAGDISNLKGSTKTSLVTRITEIKDNRIQLERRLRFDVRPEWKPVVRTFRPTVQDSGVEDLTFEFPVTPYGGHFTEQGFNPVAFVNVANCWARRLKFINPDSGPMVSGVFNTVSDVVYESSRAPDKEGQQGHHGIYMGGIGDHLFTRFDIRMKFVHDISVSHAAGVVVSKGKGVDLCFDHHKRAPYEILFTDIDLGLGTRPWKCGGGVGLGKNAGARVTFWNLHAVGPLPEPPKDFAPLSINLVGVNVGSSAVVDPAGMWREILSTEELRPADLYESQLARRLARQ
ncbi:MAG: glycosyl hydrolase family 28-related protein [Opitutaceae bacterium]|jgi:hypothetical protein